MEELQTIQDLLYYILVTNIMIIVINLFKFAIDIYKK